MEFGQVASTASGRTFKPVAAHDEHVLDPAVGQICAHRCPQCSAFIISDPQSQDVLDAVYVDTNRHVASLVDHAVPVADLDAGRVEEDHRVELISLAVVPHHDLFQDRVGNGADRIRAHIHPKGGREMMANIAHCHPAGVERDDHVVEFCEPACAFGHHAGSKRAGTIPGHSYFHRAVSRIDGLAVRPVAVVILL